MDPFFSEASLYASRSVRDPGGVDRDPGGADHYPGGVDHYPVGVDPDTGPNSENKQNLPFLEKTTPDLIFLQITDLDPIKKTRIRFRNPGYGIDISILRVKKKINVIILVRLRLNCDVKLC